MNRNPKLIVALLAAALMLAACGGGAVDPTEAPDASSTSTSTAAPTTAAPSTSTTIETTTTVQIGIAPIEIDRLDNGLPATFVAVTEDWEAVEIDTATGEVIRSIGQLDQPSETGEEPGFFNAIQNIWRSADGAWYAISTCCEPAAGAIYFIPQDGILSSDNLDEAILTPGWTTVPSPYDQRFAWLGFSMLK